MKNLCSTGEVQELIEATNSTPGIVVVTPEDGDSETTPTVCRQDNSVEPRLRMSALPRHLVQTTRPPLTQSS